VHFLVEEAMKFMFISGIAVVALVVAGFIDEPIRSNGFVNSVQEKNQDTQESQEEIKAKLRQTFMRGKLVSNQKIIEGLSVKNFDLISEGAAGTKAMVKGQHWFVIDSPEYKRFSNEMELAASRLEQAAKDKNLDAAALRYFDLTLNCLDCHGYIEGRKY
jgi:hypothetical protein